MNIRVGMAVTALLAVSVSFGKDMYGGYGDVNRVSNAENVTWSGVLSVGDGAFKKKSEAKMREILASGATTILVSHSIGQVRALCNKILWLHKGEQVVFTDDVEGACDSYEEFLKTGKRDEVHGKAEGKQYESLRDGSRLHWSADGGLDGEDWA